MKKLKMNGTTFIIIILMGLLFMSFINIAWERKKEGYYNNNTLYYSGCNPLLYTQSPGCSGCGNKVDSCWRESTICGVDKPCY